MGQVNSLIHRPVDELQEVQERVCDGCEVGQQEVLKARHHQRSKRWVLHR